MSGEILMYLEWWIGNFIQSQFLKMIGYTFLLEKWKFDQLISIHTQVKFSPKIHMNSSISPFFLLPRFSSKLKVPMNYNAVSKNIKINKIGVLEVVKKLEINQKSSCFARNESISGKWCTFCQDWIHFWQNVHVLPGLNSFLSFFLQIIGYFLYVVVTNKVSLF